MGKVIAIVVTASALCLGVGTNVFAATVNYDAGLGTLPSAQGWVHNTNGLPESNYSVANGSLTQGSTAPDSNLQSYRVNLSFDFSTDTVRAFADLKILESTLFFGPDTGGVGTDRAGFGVDFRDSAGRYFALYVGESALFLLGENDRSSGLIDFDTTDDIHLYELVVNNAGATLSIDGTPTASLPIGDFRILTTSDQMGIGDLSTAKYSSSELREFGIAVVPIPATLPLLGAALVGLGFLAKRRTV